MSVNFATKYFNSIYNVLNNGQYPLVKDVDELGELVLYIMYIRNKQEEASIKNEKS